MNEDLIWYAAYGSNLNVERFMCYIKGGKPRFSKKPMQGCRDETPPRKSRKYKDNYELYFAKYSGLWDGGVCFINNLDSTTYFTLYLVSEDQFRDITFQECGFEKDKSKLEFKLKKNDFVFNNEKWYGKILYIGELDGYPIYSITSPKDYTEELNQPSSYYLYHIIKGLNKNHNLSEDEIKRYLVEKRGLDDNSELRSAFEIYKN